jgi:hypothetical protein
MTAPDEVVRVVQAALPARVLRRHPAATDDGEEDVGRRHRRLDPLDEVDSRLDCVDVHEDPVLAEVLLELVVDAARIAGGFLAPIADEDLRDGAPPSSSDGSR